MSPTVCPSAYTLGRPQGRGHDRVFLNWAPGQRAPGCRVIRLEGLRVAIGHDTELRSELEAMR